MPVDAARSRDAEAAYCEARARYYIGEARTRLIYGYELEGWLQAERSAACEELQTRLAAIRALMRHVQGGLELVVSKLEAAAAEQAPLAMHAADVPELVERAQAVFALWRGLASQEMYGELLREGMDRCDFDVLEEAMGGLNEALRAFDT
jgi:hypothetical protein